MNSERNRSILAAFLAAAPAMFPGFARTQDWATPDGKPPYPLQTPAKISDKERRKLEETHRKHEEALRRKIKARRSGSAEPTDSGGDEERRENPQDWDTPDGKPPYPMQAPAKLSREDLQALEEARRKRGEAVPRSIEAHAFNDASDDADKNDVRGQPAWSTADGKPPFPMQTPAKLSGKQRKELEQARRRRKAGRPNKEKQDH